MNPKIAKILKKWFINKKFTIQDFITGYWFLPKKLGQQLRKQHGYYITTIINDFDNEEEPVINVPGEPHDISHELRIMTQEEAMNYQQFYESTTTTASDISIDTYTNQPEQNITPAELREVREQLNNYNTEINQDE